MCLAIPALIKTMDENGMAEVDLGGVTRRISLALTPEAQVGNYVIVHTGFAISVLDEEEANETLQLFREMEAAAEAEEGSA